LLAQCSTIKISINGNFLVVNALFQFGVFSGAAEGIFIVSFDLLFVGKVEFKIFYTEKSVDS